MLCRAHICTLSGLSSVIFDNSRLTFMSPWGLCCGRQVWCTLRGRSGRACLLRPRALHRLSVSVMCHLTLLPGKNHLEGSMWSTCFHVGRTGASTPSAAPAAPSWPCGSATTRTRTDLVHQPARCGSSVGMTSSNDLQHEVGPSACECIPNAYGDLARCTGRLSGASRPPPGPHVWLPMEVSQADAKGYVHARGDASS